MTNPILSNSVENKAVILWQYDKARNLVTLIDGFNQIATDTVTQFWDYFRDCVFNIDTADTFGLNVLGRLLGLPRPNVEIDDEVQPISDDLFRRLLKGRFFLFGMSPTVPNYNTYLSIIWGILPADCFPIVYSFPGREPVEIEGEGVLRYADRTETIGGVFITRYRDFYDARDNTLLFTMRETASIGTYVYSSPNPTEGFTITFAGETPSGQETESKAAVLDGMDMSMVFPAPNAASDEETAMHEQHPDLIYFYPAGIRTNAMAVAATDVIGMHGQTGLENFADAFSWVENPTQTGGIFAGNDKAKFLDGKTIEQEEQQ